MPTERPPVPRLPEAAGGVRAAKQSRSQAKREALLAAGRRLLRQHDLPGLSVAQVAAEAGVAVGSFYTRFDDKNAWFAELCRQAGSSALAELQQLLDGPAMRAADAAGQVGLLMAWLTRVHREHQGIYRAAVSDPARTHLYWGPLMRLCEQVVARVYRQLEPHLQALAPALRRQRVEFAFQVVFSTLVNAVLHDGAWLRLDNPALEHELARVFLAAVGVPDKA